MITHMILVYRMKKHLERRRGDGSCVSFSCELRFGPLVRTSDCDVTVHRDLNIFGFYSGSGAKKPLGSFFFLPLFFMDKGTRLNCTLIVKHN